MSKSSEFLTNAHIQDLLHNVDNFLFDCDGVLWNSDVLIPGSLDTIRKLKKLGKNVYFITNNSTKTRKEYCKKFTDLKFDVKEEEIIGTAYIAALYLHNHNFKGKVYAVGSSGLSQELNNFNIAHTGIGPDPVVGHIKEWCNIKLDPEVTCVLVAFDEHISYQKIIKAATYIKKRNCLFLATNEDTVMPMPGDIVIPGTGTIVNAVKTPAEKEPIYVGKPHSTIIDLLKSTKNLVPGRSIMIGDRLNTDIAFAKNHQLKSLLVLSGISTKEDIHKEERNSDNPNAIVPDFYLPSLKEFAELLPE